MRQPSIHLLIRSAWTSFTEEFVIVSKSNTGVVNLQVCTILWIAISYAWMKWQKLLMTCQYFSKLYFKENVSSLKSSLNSSIASLH